MINTTYLPPFKRMCITIGNLPSSFMESMSYYEALQWLYNYLDKTIIPAINTEGEAITELQAAMITLKDYVDNYFENLDIQTEINNKLDEMAESGELADIIAQYLEVASVLGFDTKASLKAAENLTNGSIAKTLGDTTYNDGKGNFYKIRTLTSSDTIDDNNILALSNYPTLIAEKMPDYRINQIESNLDNLNLLVNKKYLLVGDSYATGYQGSGETPIEGFYTKVVNDLGITAQIVAANGYGFMGIDGTHKWLTLLQSTTIANKESFTDIIILGGMNDRGQDSDYQTAMEELFTYLGTNFPNATIHVGCVGKYRATATANNLNAMRRTSTLYKYYSTINGHKYIDNSELILHNMDWFIEDNIHPNNKGEKQLAYGLEQYLLNGAINTLTSVSDFQDFQEDTITPEDNITFQSLSIYSFITPSNVNFYLGGNINFTENVTLSNLTEIVIGVLSKSYVCASTGYQGIDAVITGYVYSTNLINNSHYVKVDFRIWNDNLNKLHLKAFTVMDNGNLNNSMIINQIAFPYGMIKMNADPRYC